MTFQSLPLTARKITATESRLQRIYEAAKLGMKGESLALAAGLLPEEYRRLCQMDPVAEMAELKGRADGEQELAAVMMNAAKSGDTKAALEILKHRHDWVAKQQVQIDVAQQISIITALEQAEQRVGSIGAQDIDDAIVTELPNRANGSAALTNQRNRDDDGYQHFDTDSLKRATAVRS